jgi:hypothetical protein
MLAVHAAMGNVFTGRKAAHVELLCNMCVCVCVCVYYY